MGSNKVWPTSKGCLNGKYHFVTHLTGREPHKTLDFTVGHGSICLNDVRNYDYVDKLYDYIDHKYSRDILHVYPSSRSPSGNKTGLSHANPPFSLRYISVWTDKMNVRWTCYTYRNLVKDRPTQVVSCINSCSQTVRMAEDPLLTIASSYSCSIELAQKFDCA